MSVDQHHPSPHVRLLAQWADEDDIVEVIVLDVCRKLDCRNLTDLFKLNPGLVEELHDQVVMLLDDTDPASDDLTELGLMPDPTLEWTEEVD